MDGPLLKFTHPVSIHRSAVAPKHATRNARIGQEQMKRNTPGDPSPNAQGPGQQSRFHITVRVIQLKRKSVARLFSSERRVRVRRWTCFVDTGPVAIV